MLTDERLGLDAVRLGRKEGLQPRANERPAVGCSEKLGGPYCYDVVVNASREIVLPAQRVRSLTWVNDTLIDFAAGGVRYELDGSRSEAPVYWAYPFDSAVAAANFAVLYTRLGTKAVLLKDGKILRELNRSFYHAHVYEYAVCLTEHDGRMLLVHCPED